MTTITYTGTAEDYKLLLAEGTLDPQDPFEVISLTEGHYRLMKWAILKTKHTAFWSGYKLASHDAAAALVAIEPKPSLLARLAGWLA